VVSEKGVKRVIYCGLASKPESNKKALELELEYVTERGRQLEKEGEDLRKQIANIDSSDQIT